MKLKDASFLKEKLSICSVLKSRGINLPTKVCIVKAVVFPAVMYWCESWTMIKGYAPKNGCFWTVVLEKTLERPLDCKEIKPVNPKGNQSWIYIGRTDAEAEAPILWLPDAKSWLIRKDPDAGKDWGQEKKGVTEDEMVGWYHWLNGHECEQTAGDGEGLGSLACCSPWGRRVGCDWVSEQGLRCGMWDLELRHVGSSSLTMNWAWALWHWESGILATGLPRKAHGFKTI